MPQKRNFRTNSDNNNNNRKRNVFPPDFKSEPIATRKFRFQASAACTSTIFRECLLSLMVASSAASDTSSLPLLHAVLIKRVQIWAVASTNSSPLLTNASLKWLSNWGNDQEISATGNANEPAHISSSPPKDSFASMWSKISTTGAESESLFSVVCSTDSIVDVTVEYVHETGAPNRTCTTSALTSSVGFAPLDCLNGSGAAGPALLVPIAAGTVVAVTARA